MKIEANIIFNTRVDSLFFMTLILLLIPTELYTHHPARDIYPHITLTYSRRSTHEHLQNKNQRATQRS